LEAGLKDHLALEPRDWQLHVSSTTQQCLYLGISESRASRPFCFAHTAEAKKLAAAETLDSSTSPLQPASSNNLMFMGDMM
jgi:hypothetical protein